MSDRIFPYRGVWPKIGDNVFIAPNAQVIGDVKIGAGSSIWFGAVLRGDVMPIRVGERTSIQDNSVVHATSGVCPCEIGSSVTVGHGVVLHGCRIRDRVLVGMGSVILDEAQIESDVMLGAGSLVTQRTTITSGTLAFGRPAQEKRPLTERERAHIRDAVTNYDGLRDEYLRCADFPAQNYSPRGD